MAPPPYKYTPLARDADHIRLLTLLPAGDESGEIIITLRNSPKEEITRQYEALSYVWGSADNPEAIRIVTSAAPGAQDDDVPGSSDKAAALHVTENLASALRHLRRQDAARTLWIDAICIDQQNVAERSEQVGKMGEIYSSATRVLVWLGPESPDSDLAMKLVDQLGKVLQFDPLSEAFTLKWNGAAESDWVKVAEPVPYDEAEFRALQNLFARPWFERLWVVQEVLNSTEAIVVCGRQQTSWQSVMVTVCCLERKNTKTSPREGWRSRLVQIEDVFDTSYDRGLLNLVDRTRELQCTDDRDRIYAVLSLAKDRVKIKPDYSLSTIQVFREVAVHVFNQRQATFLAYCDLRSRRLPLPSWIPDWTAERMTERIQGCSAARFAAQEIIERPSEECVRISAVRVGTVVDVDIVSIPSLNNTLIIDEILRLLPIDVESSTYTTGCSLLEAFSCTLVCQGFRPQVPHKPDNETVQMMVDAVRACLRYREGAIFEQTWENRTYLGDVYCFTKNRALFRTDQGYIGLAPSNVKAGDTILAVLSCRSFTVVRPAPENEGSFNVVGEAFVYGLHNSEAVLGPLPEHVRALDHWHPEFRGFYDAYHDTRTGETSWIDPRLEALGIPIRTGAMGLPFMVEGDDLQKADIRLSRFDLV